MENQPVVTAETTFSQVSCDYFGITESFDDVLRNLAGADFQLQFNVIELPPGEYTLKTKISIEYVKVSR